MTEVTPITITFAQYLDPAGQIRQKINSALDLIAEAAADIENIGSDFIIYRGLQVSKTDVVADLGDMIALSDKVDLYLHQLSKNNHLSQV